MTLSTRHALHMRSNVLRRLAPIAFRQPTNIANMSIAIPRDVRLFLDNYPDQEDDETQSANLEFYSNKRKSQPDNVLISEIHQR